MSSSESFKRAAVDGKYGIVIAARFGNHRRMLLPITIRQTVFAAFFCSTAVAADTPGMTELSDVVARIQYAAFAGDLGGLRQALAALQRVDGDAILSVKRVHEAYGEWKIAEVLAARDTDGAAAAAERCTELTKREGGRTVASGDADRDDRLALHAICLDVLSGLRALRAPLYKRQRDQSLREAVAADARSPCVLLAQALIGSAQGDAEEIRARFARAVDALAEAPGEPERPKWGYAEALVALGEYELGQGNALAARNAFERVLVLAPDHQRARILLEQAAVR